jgi:hypothetical protein
MDIAELIQALQVAKNLAGTGCPIVIEDAGGELHALAGAVVDTEHQVLVLRVTARPLELRGA